MSILFSPLSDLLASHVQVAVMRVLTGESRARSGREIARAARVSHTPALRVLMDYVARGLVQREDVGRTALFSLYREHPLVAALIQPVFAAERAWPTLFFSTLTAWLTTLEKDARTSIVWAGLFGSLARGDDVATSDIDVCILAPTDRDADQLRDVASTRDTAFGHGRVSTLFLGLQNLRQLRSSGNTLPAALISEARTLYGTDDVERLLHDES